MQWSEVLKRIADGETEFKRGLGDLKGVGRTLCAFANTTGGLLILGVEGSKEISGVREDPEKVQMAWVRGPWYVRVTFQIKPGVSQIE